jgi:hypothetical protein
MISMCRVIHFELQSRGVATSPLSMTRSEELSLRRRFDSSRKPSRNDGVDGDPNGISVPRWSLSKSPSEGKSSMGRSITKLATRDLCQRTDNPRRSAGFPKEALIGRLRLAGGKYAWRTTLKLSWHHVERPWMSRARHPQSPVHAEGAEGGPGPMESASRTLRAMSRTTGFAATR